ncbi:retrovirus-related pol polyprotein from transposon TNT 1-94 [Tanacetum coccineum]
MIMFSLATFTMKILIASIHSIGANDSLKWIPSSCRYPFATNRALFFKTSPYSSSFTFEADRTLDFRALDFRITQLTEKVTVLQEQNEIFRAENAKIKQHYKELYDSIKITRDKHIKQTTALLTENENLKAQIHENLKCITMDSVKPRVLAPGRYAMDVEPIPPHNRNNREVHLDYLKHLKESVETLCEIVEEAKVERPLDRSLASACLYTKQSQELLEYVIGTYLKDFNQQDKKQASTPLTRKKQVTFEDQCVTSNNNAHKHVEKLNIQKTNVPVNSFYISRIDHPLVFGLTLLKIYDGDRSRLKNFVKKFIGTVRFENDHFGAIMGYGDYVIGDSVISRVYYVEGLGHNMFFVRQFCDSDLEVAFRKHSCYVRDTDGVELIKGSRGSNSSPICLLSKASKEIMNGVVKRQYCTLVEAARTMLIFSKAPMFLWAEAVATSCYTQNRSLIHTRHNKTPYELVHDKKPDLTFLRVFGALCYPTNDSEDLGKLQPTADIGISLLSEPMAPVHLGTGPAPSLLTLGQISSGLVPNPVPAASYVPLTNKELEILFQPMFDEYLEPLGVERPVPSAPAVQVPVVSVGTPSSTTIDQDAPSTSYSSSSSVVQPPISPQGVAAGLTIEDNPFAQADNEPFENVFAPEPSFDESSSRDVNSAESTQVVHPYNHLKKWSKDHPLDNVIGNPSCPVSTRK